MELITYAQNFEDLRLWNAFRDVGIGRYLDIGAQHPTHDSVSKLFYDRGWRGIHVEPTPTYAAAIRSTRPDETVIEAAVSSSSLPLVFFEIPNTGLSTGVPEIARFHQAAGWESRQIVVPTFTLASLFDFMGQDPIHWLKIDVEGMEADVLASWGQHSARPAALVIEATKPSTQEQTHEPWQAMVIDRGYREVLFDGLSRYFIHESEAHRADALALSPNVFDGFQVLRGHFSVQHVAAENDRAISELRSEAETKTKAYLEQMAETAATAAEASAQLDAALQRTAELEGRVAFEAQAHADTLAKLDLANGQAEGMERRLQEQARLHAVAISVAEERVSAGQHSLAVSNGQLADIQAEHLALTRLTGRLEVQAEALECRLQEQARLHAVAISVAEERASAGQHSLAVSNGQLAAIQAEHLALTRFTGRLEGQLEAREQWAAVKIAEELEVTKQEAAEVSRALGNEIESLRAALALREIQIAGAQELLACIPDPLTGISRLRQALARRLIGSSQLSAMADYRAAALAWQHDSPLDRAQNNPYGRPKIPGNSMITDDGPITSVEQLLAYPDRSFIHATYRSVLGRTPEPEGEAYYLARLRAGAHKIAILKQLRRSPEGRTYAPAVAGLDRAIKRHLWATRPLIGPIVRFFTGAEGNGATHRQLRIVANDVRCVLAEHAELRAELAVLCSENRELAEFVQRTAASPPPELQQQSELQPPSLDYGPLPVTLDSTERRILAGLCQLAATSGSPA